VLEWVLGDRATPPLTLPQRDPSDLEACCE
jgi:hypothetical protein